MNAGKVVSSGLDIHQAEKALPSLAPIVIAQPARTRHAGATIKAMRPTTAAAPWRKP